MLHSAEAAEKVIEAHPDLIFQLGYCAALTSPTSRWHTKIDNGDIGKVVLVRSYTQDHAFHTIGLPSVTTLRRSVPRVLRT